MERDLREAWDAELQAARRWLVAGDLASAFRPMPIPGDLLRLLRDSRN